tara:strand:- start:9062 stop:10099 length:1038 start_codon:yes stop_codon:yes gene_type:complete
MRSRAAILVEQKKPLVLADVEVPEPTFGQVLVEIETSGICGTQLGEISGKKGPDRWLPHMLGHEAVGVVKQVGPHVTTVAEGDRVVLHWRQGAGIQAPTAKYKWGDKTVNAGWITTFQELTVVSENRVTKISPEISAEEGVLYGCAIPTAFGVINNDANVKVGESCVIFGIGGVGQAVVMAAKLAGAHPIIAVDIVDEKLELAKRFGATHTINSKSEDAEAKIREILGGTADVVIENTGVLAVMDLCYRIAANVTGRTILVGVPDADQHLTIDSMPLHFGKVLTGSFGGMAKPDYDLPRLQRMHLAGRFDLSPMVTHRFGLEEINTALDTMRSGEAVRCVLRMRD